MRRFFIKPESLLGDCIQVSGPEARHILTVLRLRPGDTVEFFDTDGTVHTAILSECSKGRILARVLSSASNSSVQQSPLILAQALIKGKKMDMVVQKATELGVQRFIPIKTRYSESHQKGERQAERWLRIMIEACKQCLRTLPMQIDDVTGLERLDLGGFSQCLVAWEKEASTPFGGAFSKTDGPTLLLIGPEGGFHPDEIHLLEDQGAKLFSLGEQVLRAETAALAAISITQYLSGNLNPGGSCPIDFSSEAVLSRQSSSTE